MSRRLGLLCLLLLLGLAFVHKVFIDSYKSTTTNDGLRQIQQKQDEIFAMLEKLVEKQDELVLPRNVLYIKIPKTGSTTLKQVLFTSTAKAFKFTGAYIDPIPNGGERLCHTNHTLAFEAWVDYTNTNIGGRLDLFAYHACFMKEMLDPQYWTLGQKPFTLTMMRNPYEQFISRYRYVRHCCENSKLQWCQNLCPHIKLDAFIKKTCHAKSCDQQSSFMRDHDYDLVMLVERFTESLAVLGVKLNIPSWALLYIPLNTNVFVGKATYAFNSSQQRQEFEHTYLAKDWEKYAHANWTLDSTIANFSPIQHKTFLESLHDIEAGTRRLSNKCFGPCAYNYTRLDPCMRRCWSQELRVMAKELQWRGALVDYGYVSGSE